MSGKVALVTGASRGIGQAIAIALGKKGAVVAGTATTQEGADKITAALKAEHISGEGFVLNVTELESVNQALSTITEKLGAPLILVNNAAITQDNILLRMKPQEWDQVIDTNLSSLYRITKPCLKSMFKARWGRIINVSSVVGTTGNPGQTNYAAAKAGMIGFSKSLAIEMASLGITVNVVAPGFIDTDMTRKLNDQQKEMINNQIPMKRIGQATEIANVVAFLASDEASYMTGQTLHVNGGMFMS